MELTVDAAAYRHALQQLLPPGAAWPRGADAVLTRLLAAWADELARGHRRLDDLVAEADPRSAAELLGDWETALGLPDPCTAGSADSLQDRRRACHAKLTGRGGQSRAFFIGLAAALGYAVTITEFPRHTCESGCEDPVTGEDWAFVWRVDAPDVTIHEFACTDHCETPLRWWGNGLLECAIGRTKPAHTTALFAYGGP